MVGFLSIRGQGDEPHLLTAFHQGLKEVGYVDGQNVTMEYRWAEGQNARLPAMAADLVHREVTVITATPTLAALAARTATTTIPIVFETGADPVEIGLVASLNRPGGNVTGVTPIEQRDRAKAIGVLAELIPTATVMALLVNPADPIIAEANSSAVLSAAHRLGLELHVLNAAANATSMRSSQNCSNCSRRPCDRRRLLFNARIEQLAALTVQHAVPPIFETREFVAAGRLISYGAVSPTPIARFVLYRPFPQG